MAKSKGDFIEWNIKCVTLKNNTIQKITRYKNGTTNKNKGN